MFHRAGVVIGGVVLIVVLSGAGLPGSAAAQDIGEMLRPLLEPPRPVLVPADAVVIPYDPADIAGRDKADRVLVPYQRYVELWNLAHPEAKIGEATSSERFSFAGARYDIVLGDDEHIVLNGKLEIELFVDEAVEVPLALRQAVITSALLDGQPARLQAVQAAPQPAAPAGSERGGRADSGRAAAHPARARKGPPSAGPVGTRGRDQARGLEASQRDDPARRGDGRANHRAASGHEPPQADRWRRDWRNHRCGRAGRRCGTRPRWSLRHDVAREGLAGAVDQALTAEAPP